LGGQAIQAQRLIAGLREHAEVHVTFLPVNPSLPGPLARLQRVKYVRTVFTSLWYWAHLVRAVPGHDLLHILSASYWSFLLAPVPALVAAKVFRRPTILNYRSGEASDHLQRSAMARRLIRRFDAIVVPSGYLVDVFRRFAFTAGAIPNIIDFAQLRYRVRDPIRPIFLSNRHLEPLYNVACTLRAFRTISDRYPDARLAIVGGGSERRALEQLCGGLNLTGVTFHGRVSPAQMGEFYDRADVYLNSPNIDNMPTSILEAQACGLPVATTNAGGIPYIVSDEITGLLVPCDDSEALARAALRYLEDRQLATHVIQHAYSGIQRYRRATVSANWVRIYRQVSGGERAAAC